MRNFDRERSVYRKLVEGIHEEAPFVAERRKIDRPAPAEPDYKAMWEEARRALTEDGCMFTNEFNAIEREHTPRPKLIIVLCTTTSILDDGSSHVGDYELRPNDKGHEFTLPGVTVTITLHDE